MSLKKQTIRDHLWLYAKSTIDPELILKYATGLVDILEYHPSLGTAWGEKADAILRDMSEALADLEE